MVLCIYRKPNVSQSLTSDNHVFPKCNDYVFSGLVIW